MTLSQRRMPIDARAELFHRIVEMKRVEVLEANRVVEGPKRCGPPFCCSDVVACDKDVAGVDADAQRQFVPSASEDVAQMFEAVTHAGPLPSCRLEQEARGAFLYKRRELH